MKKTEIIFVILFILAIGLDLVPISGGSSLIVLTLTTLSMIYCFLGFALFNEIKLRNIFKKDSYKEISPLRILGAVGAGNALSAMTVGIMYKIQHWTGANGYLGTGLVSLLIVVIIGAIKYSKTKSDYYTGIFKRIAIFGGLGLILMILPNTFIVDIKYRSEPDYCEALKKAIENPDDKELWGKVNEEYQKMQDKKYK